MSPSTAALVTGCSTGIGRAVAERLFAAGYPVYATARRPGDLAELADAGMVTLALDVTDDTSMRAAVDRVVADHGAVGVLVNNAGFALEGTIEETPLDDARRELETNLLGAARLCQLALPGMREQGWGRIVMMGSMGGRFTFPGSGWYHASKHALEAITDALRLEVASFGVHVSLVQPGPVASSYADTAVASIPVDDEGAYGGFHRELAARFAESYAGSPVVRLLSPDDVAAVVLRAVADRSPRPRYAVGVVARTMITTRRLVPDQAWDRFMRRVWPTPRGEG